MKENFKDIVGYEGMYAVSNFGRVKSLERVVQHPNFSQGMKRREMFLKQNTDKDGYKTVSLSKNGKMKTFKVHRLVAQTFISSNNTDLQVNHKNGDKQHNFVGNLEFVTCRDNIRHAFETGLSKRGENHSRAILKASQVVKIKKLLKSGTYTQKEIGAMFNVSRSTIVNIHTNKTWTFII